MRSPRIGRHRQPAGRGACSGLGSGRAGQRGSSQTLYRIIAIMLVVIAVILVLESQRTPGAGAMFTGAAQMWQELSLDL